MTERTTTGRLWEEIAIGDTAATTRVCTVDDLLTFARASGNPNPLHLPGLSEAETGRDPIAPAMWGGSLFSALLGGVLPGPGTVYLGQTLRFPGRAQPGDTLTARVTVREKREGRVLILDCALTQPDGDAVALGEAEVRAPAERIESAAALPAHFAKHGKFDRLLAACRGLPPLPTAIVWPTDDNSMGGAFEAAREGLIAPILIGPEADIRREATELGWDLAGADIEPAADPDAAAATAVAMVQTGRAGAVMKGNLHSDDLLRHVTKADGGLRAGRRISHVFVLDVPNRESFLLITDAAINIAPDLMTKADIARNAIELAHAIGLPEPRLGILSAVETINVAIPSTLDAAVLSKMAERGQIKGALVDGPLAMDNAVDLEAARTKGLHSSVAGRADILLAPNLESGNMLAKQLVFLSDADPGGLVVGARVPVMLTSRADDADARLASAALAVLYREWQQGRPITP